MFARAPHSARKILSLVPTLSPLWRRIQNPRMAPLLLLFCPSPAGCDRNATRSGQSCRSHVLFPNNSSETTIASTDAIYRQVTLGLNAPLPVTRSKQVARPAQDRSGIGSYGYGVDFGRRRRWLRAGTATASAARQGKETSNHGKI
jgi:hypothetical protein